MNKYVFAFLWGFGLSTLVSSAVLTANAAPAGEPNCVSELFIKAQKKQHEIAAQIANSRASNAAYREAISLYFPSLTASVSVTPGEVKDYYQSFQVYSGPGGTRHAGFTLNQVLFDKSVLLAIKGAQYSKESQSSILQTIQQQFYFTFTQNYLSVLAAYLRRTIAEGQIKILSGLLTRARSMNPPPNPKTLDFLVAAHMPLKVVLNQAKSAQATAVRNLETMTGEKITSIYFPPEDYNYLAGRRMDRETRYREAVLASEKYSPFVRLAKINEKSAEYRATMAKFPDITLSAFAGESYDSSTLSGGPAQRSGDRAAFVGLSVSSSLNFFGMHSRIEKSKYEALGAAELVEKAKGDLKPQISAAVDALYAGYDNFTALHEIDPLDDPKRSRIQIAGDEIKRMGDCMNDPTVGLDVIVSKIAAMNNAFAVLSQDIDILQSIVLNQMLLARLTGELTEASVEELNRALTQKVPLVPVFPEAP